MSKEHQYCIMRITKLHTNGNVGGAISHHLRTRETDNADPEKMVKNWYYPNFGNDKKAEQKDIEFRRKLQRTSMSMYRKLLPKKIRKNGVRAVEFMMTVSPEVMSRKDFQVTSYLNDCGNWVREKFGKENVFFIAHHLDETTPHVSILITPIDEKGNLNARKFFGGRDKLSALQTDFYEKVGRKYGLERGVQGSHAKHQTIKDYYAKQNKQVEQLEDFSHRFVADLPEKSLFQSQEDYAENVRKYTNEKIKNIKPMLQKAINAEQTESRLDAMKTNVSKQVAQQVAEQVNKINQSFIKTTTLTYDDGIKIRCEGGIYKGLRDRADRAYNFNVLTPTGFKALAERMEKLGIESGREAYDKAQKEGCELGEWIEKPLKINHSHDRGYGGMSM